MLCLTRKPGEKIVIGEGVTVEVVEVRGDKVKLGIVAPRDVPIDRLEIREAKEKDRASSQKPQPKDREDAAEVRPRSPATH